MEHGAPQRQSNKTYRGTAAARIESPSAAIADSGVLADLRFAH